MRKAKVFARALRLPFISASILPFVLGSLLVRSNFHVVRFLLGLTCVACTHLSANCINDYADARSGADWKDLTFYGFFGGSKLIQEKILTESFYLRISIFFAVCAFFAVALLTFLMASFLPVIFFFLIVFLAWSYSAKPLQLSYHRLGEPIIFLLFGPVLVMGGYFIQSGIFPTMQGFLASLPMGFLVSAILFVNEIPDYREDRDAGKHTWVGLTGPDKAWILYLFLIVAAFISVIINVAEGLFGILALISLICVLPALKAGTIARIRYNDKISLRVPSQLTIATHSLVSCVLIMDLVIRWQK